jgi:glycosyltransferase involved in cell wall biosynthesis
MTKRPYVSIITPVFNQRLYIQETIASVLGQTYPHWEWIILDDGSTDGTGDIIQGMKDSRIHYTYQENAGVSVLAKTFNKALALCNGDLIALLDSDDYWPRYNLETQVKSFQDPDVVLSYGECCVVNQKGKKITSISIPDDPGIAGNTPVGTGLKRFIDLRYPLLQPSVVMVKHQTLVKIGGFVYRKDLPQDLPTWTTLALEGRFSAIPLYLGYWRRHYSSATVIRDQEHLFDIVVAFLREFLVLNEKRLRELGFSFTLEDVEKDWEERRKEYVAYLPYNMAMLMLRIGLFDDAKREFRKFLKSNPSGKNKLIAACIHLSGLIHYDVVNPLATFKEKAGKIW